MFGKDKRTETKNREIFSTRIFYAPRELVWLFWCDPEQLKNWCFPSGFSNPSQEQKLKGPRLWPLFNSRVESKERTGEIICLQSEKPSRIVFKHVRGAEYIATATLEEHGEDCTKLSLHAIFNDVAEYDAVKDFAHLGIEQSFDRLESNLGKFQGSEPARELVIQRTYPYEESRDLLWKFWTNPEYMARWWGPKGSIMGHAHMDFRRAGSFHYCLITPDGNESWGKFFYRDIVTSKRLLWVNTLSDSQAKIVRHPIFHEMPLEVMTMVTFGEKIGPRTVSVQCWPINAPEAEIKVFNDALASLKQHWTFSLDRLGDAMKTYLNEGWSPKPGTFLENR